MSAHHGRRSLHAYIERDTHEAWANFCADAGTTISALLEAIGEEIYEVLGDNSPVVKRARRISHERTRRDRT